MSGLADLNHNTPTGLDTPTRADNELRAIKSKIKEYAAVEHSYDGKHKFQLTPLLPANDAASRRLVIKTTIGLPDELWYDDGVNWKKITNNSEILVVVADLLTHKTAAILDHPNSSVTTDKLKDSCVTSIKIGIGEILRSHLNALQTPELDGTTAPLVDGSEVDATWHTHPIGNTAFGMHFLDSEILVASGGASLDWATHDAYSSSGGVIPITAKGVILRVEFNIEVFILPLHTLSGRASVSSAILPLYKSVIPSDHTVSFAQVLCPLTGTDGTFQYKVDFESAGTWDIYIQGYFT